MTNIAAAEAEARLHTADYVEARGILLPATEYFSKAVESAEEQGIIDGPLLARVSISQLYPYSLASLTCD